MKKARGTGDTSAIALRDAHATDPARSPEDRSTPVRLLSGTTTPMKDWGPPSKMDAREVVPPLQANGNLPPATKARSPVGQTDRTTAGHP